MTTTKEEAREGAGEGGCRPVTPLKRCKQRLPGHRQARSGHAANERAHSPMGVLNASRPRVRSTGRRGIGVDWALRV